jgi:trimeric autotransporter adhesin
LANTIEVTDYIPTGLILNDANWTQSGTLAKRTITNIAAGTSKVVSIQFKIAANPPASITNLAEISSDDGADCDSTPDSNSSNDGIVTNDAIGTSCEPGGDEDDHDPETIPTTSTPVSSCISLSASPLTAQNSLTSTLSCTGSGASSYKIEVKNSAGTVVQTLNAQSGSVTLGTIGNYTASCYVNNETTAPATCTKDLSVTTPGSSSG